MSKVYDLAKRFKKKYPLTVAWRIKAHCRIIDKHLFDDEKIKYVFLGQKNYGAFDFINTNVIVLTNKRLMLGTKRVMFGYFFTAITPDMFNDLTIKRGLVWGSVIIDTIKEVVTITNVSPRALSEIDKNVTSVMIEEKKKYGLNREKSK